MSNYTPTTEAVRAKYARGKRSDGTHAQFIKWQKDSLMGNWVRTDNGKLVRRVKAGAWEPVPDANERNET